MRFKTLSIYEIFSTIHCPVSYLPGIVQDYYILVHIKIIMFKQYRSIFHHKSLKNSNCVEKKHKMGKNKVKYTKISAQ